jgi:nicotinate-nucleotide--dimethylbenzimidazole phosphoribosyltransferase
VIRKDEPAASLDEIRGLLEKLPEADSDCAAAAAEREARLTKPPGALGRLEELARWLSAWQGRHPPRLERPRVCVFAANHGVAARGVSAYPAEVTAEMVRNFIDGGAAINQLCKAADAELRVYEMALDQPTRDFAAGPAMDDEECARAVAYGMMSVDEDIDLLCLGEMGIGNTTSAAALCAALLGGGGADWVGPGTGVAGAGYARKLAVVDEALALHRADLADPLDGLRRLGGRELAAIAGAVLAARMGRVPVLLDGFACTAAALALERARPGALAHCQVAHISAEPGHRRLLSALGMTPLLDLGMRLGEGSGAAVAIALVRAAASCHGGMATFADAGISGPIDDTDR